MAMAGTEENMIKKSDVLKIATANDQAAYEHFSAIIDDALQRYDGTCNVAVAIPTEMSTKVIKMIKEAYGGPDGGWSVKRDKGDDERESWDNLVFS